MIGVWAINYWRASCVGPTCLHAPFLTLVIHVPIGVRLMPIKRRVAFQPYLSRVGLLLPPNFLFYFFLFIVLPTPSSPIHFQMPFSFAFTLNLLPNAILSLFFIYSFTILPRFIFKCHFLLLFDFIFYSFGVIQESSFFIL